MTEISVWPPFHTEEISVAMMAEPSLNSAPREPRMSVAEMRSVLNRRVPASWLSQR